MTDEDDSRLFRLTVGPVRPMLSDRAPPEPRRPPPAPRRHTADPEAVLDNLSDGDDALAVEDLLAFQRPGVQHRLMLRLRQGRIPVERDLDLHGHTVAEARLTLVQFLALAKADGLRCVRIVHGKGYRSPDQRPVLKARLASWLRQHSDVLAFCSTLPGHGGTGAVYVLLRG